MNIPPTHRAGKPRDAGPSPGRTAALAVVLLLALARGVFAALAPPEESFEISAKELSGPAGQITLPTEWHYHAGDDPAYAAPDVDHSQWRKADIRLRPDQVPADWQGIGWFRLRFRVDPSLRGVPLGLLVHQLGAAEVYLDGNLLLTLGTVDPDPAKAVEYVQRRPHLFAFDDVDEHVLAVRYCHHDPGAYESLGRSGGFLITLSPGNEGMTAWARDAETLSAYQAFFTGVFAVFAILHLLLFVFYPESRENLDFALPRGGIVGIIGANGAGKTTLFRMIVGQEQADAGTLTIGSTVQASYVDQSREALDPGKTVYQEISDGADVLDFGGREVNARAYCAGFNFRGTDQQKKVGILSGGERNRLHLAKLLKTGGNLLLLDEPTNDLDVDTLRALEDALVAFPGCAVVISHDRWFLDRIATHILAFEGESRVVWFEGNYTEYDADRHARLGAAADIPHRIKYRQLTRS